MRHCLQEQCLAAKHPCPIQAPSTLILPYLIKGVLLLTIAYLRMFFDSA